MNLKYTDCLPKYMAGLTNIKRANQVQYHWLYEHGCQHRHRYSRHFNCFLQEFGIEEKIGYIDTEFYVGRNRWGRLAGDWGFLLCWCIGDGKGKYSQDSIKSNEVSTIQDKRIVKSCIEEIKKYDRLVHQYGDRCDIPLIRTRALYHGIDFPKYGEIYTTDLWKIAKNKLVLSANSQRVISKVLYGNTEKTEVEAALWLAASQGDKKALKKILKHCQADVRDLERNAKKLMPFIRLGKTSI
jgi:hypothetical protein